MAELVEIPFGNRGTDMQIPFTPFGLAHLCMLYFYRDWPSEETYHITLFIYNTITKTSCLAAVH